MANGYQLFVSIILAAIGFMLVRFYFLFDEVRKDVKSMLINGATRDEAIKNIESDIADLKRSENRHEGRLRDLELKIKHKPNV